MSIVRSLSCLRHSFPYICVRTKGEASTSTPEHSEAMESSTCVDAVAQPTSCAFVFMRVFFQHPNQPTAPSYHHYHHHHYNDDDDDDDGQGTLRCTHRPRGAPVAREGRPWVRCPRSIPTLTNVRHRPIDMISAVQYRKYQRRLPKTVAWAEPGQSQSVSTRQWGLWLGPAMDWSDPSTHVWCP
jgi:hypothetical protein